MQRHIYYFKRYRVNFSKVIYTNLSPCVPQILPSKVLHQRRDMAGDEASEAPALLSYVSCCNLVSHCRMFDFPSVSWHIDTMDCGGRASRVSEDVVASAVVHSAPGILTVSGLG